MACLAGTDLEATVSGFQKLDHEVCGFSKQVVVHMGHENLFKLGGANKQKGKKNSKGWTTEVKAKAQQSLTSTVQDLEVNGVQKKGTWFRLINRPMPMLNEDESVRKRGLSRS